MTRRGWIAAIAGPLAVAAAAAALVHAHVRIDPPARLGPEARAAIVSALRAAAAGDPRRPDHPALARRLGEGGPVVATVWIGGRERARASGRGRTVADAVLSAGEALSEATAEVPGAELARARIAVDVVTARGPLVAVTPLARALSLNPGLEGLGVTIDGRHEALLLPRDLAREGLLSAAQPIAFIPDFRFGLEFEGADVRLAMRAALPAGEYGGGHRRYWRFRTDSFVERRPGHRDGAPLALTRGVPPPPEVTAGTLRAGALAGGRYLVRHLADSGRFVYEVDLASGRASDPRGDRYSLPRHAGTTYYLAELYRHTGEPRLLEPIERAIDHLAELAADGGCAGTTRAGRRYACVTERGHDVAALGSTALAVVALAEYRRATGDPRYDALAARLAEWILLMQRENGSFAHRYRVSDRERDEDAHALYYSGEAALALARMHAVTGDARYRDATERALDHLIGFYDFFLGGFFFGEEHWTCIAAEAAWPALRHERYRDFCADYAAFLRRHQVQPGDLGDQADYTGSYTFTPFVPPQNTPAGSRTEAAISAYLLTSHHGDPSPAIREQVKRAMKYALSQQIRPESAWDTAGSVEPLGAVPASPVDRRVRIDYVQHVCSAMLRAIAVLDV